MRGTLTRSLSQARVKIAAEYEFSDIEGQTLATAAPCRSIGHDVAFAFRAI